MKMPAIMHSLFSRHVVPSFIVDVSDFVEEKMASIRAHVSQFYQAESQEPATRISDPAFLTFWRGQGESPKLRVGEFSLR